jgi:hypothetical protein
VARAKRTDRADARRRYRATQADAAELDDSADGESPAPAPKASAGPSRGSARATPRTEAPQRPVFAAGQRPSFTASFRAAARPFNIRDDIAYIPTLILRTRAVWVPALAAIGSGVFFLASQPLGSNGIANLLFQLFVLPPTIAGSFLAGILAPRATYIAGGIAALVGAIVFSIAVFITPTNLATATVPAASPSPVPSASAAASGSAAPSVSPAPSPTPAPSAPLSDADKFAAALQSLLISVPFGVAIGAFGGYYKRFLYASNPARQRRAIEEQRKRAQRQGQQGPKKRY